LPDWTVVHPPIETIRLPIPMDRLTPERRHRLMSRVRSKDTQPETIIRRMVFGMGYRYRLHDKRFPGKPDLVFIGRKKAIFVNGCFWHGHIGCRYARTPKSNVSFWKEKIERNRERDRFNLKRLEALGWKVLVVWQCELKDKEALAGTLYEFLEHA